MGHVNAPFSHPRVENKATYGELLQGACCKVLEPLQVNSVSDVGIGGGESVCFISEMFS